MKNLTEYKNSLICNPMSESYLFSEEECEQITNSLLEELIVSDTIPLKKDCSKIKVLTISNLFADVINNIDSHQSISSQFLI